MLIDRIREIIEEENYGLEHLYGEQGIFDYKDRYIINYNNFSISVIISTDNNDKKERYACVIMPVDKDDSSKHSFFIEIGGFPYGVRLCNDEEIMVDLIGELVIEDREMSGHDRGVI